MMFNEVPFAARFAAAAAAGFSAVECLFPYELPSQGIAAELEQHGLQNVLFNLPAGNWAAGERGLTCLPGREEEFRAGLNRALEYAQQLGTARLHAMAGVVPTDLQDKARCTYIENLKFAANELAKRGMTLLIEAINTRDIPGFFLSTQRQALAVLEEVAAENVRLQIDLYHMQIMEGDLSMNLRHYLPFCGHIQIAGVPRRAEPDEGEINYSYLFELLDELGYSGWVGCEYRPTRTTTGGLAWFQPFSARQVSIRG
jgi:hydroxypyruvate isomerase